MFALVPLGVLLTVSLDLAESYLHVAEPQPPEVAPVTFWGDYDGDGRLDLFAIYPVGEDRLFRNTGDGSFEDVTIQMGLTGLTGSRSASWGDFDGDGRLDLYVASSHVDKHLFKNSGPSGFVDVTLEAGLEHGGEELDAAWLDFDADGHPDLLLRTAQGDLLYHNLGNAAFEPVPLGIPGSVLVTKQTIVGVPTPQPGGDGTGGSGQPGPGSGSSPGPRSWGRGSNALRSLGPIGGTPLGLGGFGPLTKAPPPISATGCAASISDQAQPGACLQASTVPGLGLLYPLSNSLNVSANGNVLIKTGEVGPYSSLQVNGEILALGPSGPGYRAFSMNVYQGVAKISATSGNGETRGPLSLETSDTPRVYLDANGYVGIGTTTPTEMLDVAGSTRQQCVKITGGCDIVEGFETGGQVLEPGTVVVIDPDRPGELMASSVPYDRRVAGVVSGAGGVGAGISLAQEGTLDGSTKVAMAGRVWVKCSTENGAIVPGDRLTTAVTTGHAMKVTNDARGVGAVIGKAMTPLAEGEALVLVLVNLQ